MTAKFDGGACNYQPSVIHENTFNATVNDGAGQLYVKVLAVKAPGPVARYTYVKVPECRGWSGGWSCSAGKGTALDPEFTITKG